MHTVNEAAPFIFCNIDQEVIDLMPTKNEPNLASSGPARWTYSVSVIAAVITAIGGVVSYFVPKSEPKAATLAPTVPAPVPSVSVSGSGNVGIGVINGGQVTNAVLAVPRKTASEP